MALIDDVKQLLRITVSDFDAEINTLIDACKADLEEAGIYAVNDTDPLIKQLIALYVKGHFGYDNPEADRFLESYKMLKNKVSMLSEYNAYEITFNTLEQCEVVFDGVTKETDESGEVIFYSREKNHVPYKIADNEKQYVDVSSDMTISE